MIRSILRRTAARSSTLEDFAAHFEARLAAFGRAQAAVVRNPLAGVDLGSLLLEELLAHAMHEGEQITATGPAVHLQPRAAELFALVFNELILNAIKYGALRGDEGRVRITWRFDDAGSGPQLEFDWQESATEPGERGERGFGTELIEKKLAYELDASASLAHGSGTRCTIIVPATPRLLVQAQAKDGETKEESPLLR